MGNFFNRKPSKVGTSTDISFEIVPYEPSDGESESGNGVSGFYQVNDGYIYSTFSYDTGTFLPIRKSEKNKNSFGLKEKFEFKQNSKVYLDITVLPNLQVESVEIKCTPVGKEADPGTDKNNPLQWVNYPNMIYSQPEDEFYEDGRVKTFAEGKKQIKCYVLIGYKQNDTLKNTESQKVDEQNESIVQILKTDLILLASMYSGIPIIFPMPYLNAREHVMAIQNSGTN